MTHITSAKATGGDARETTTLLADGFHTNEPPSGDPTRQARLARNAAYAAEARAEACARLARRYADELGEMLRSTRETRGVQTT